MLAISVRINDFFMFVNGMELCRSSWGTAVRYLSIFLSHYSFQPLFTSLSQISIARINDDRTGFRKPTGSCQEKQIWKGWTLIDEEQIGIRTCSIPINAR